MIVLEGETSQWNRAVRSSFAIGPADGSPAAIRSTALEVLAHPLEVELRAERERAGLVERGARLKKAERAAEHDHPHVDLLATLDPRHEAQERIGEAGRISGGHPRPPRQTRAAAASLLAR